MLKIETATTHNEVKKPLLELLKSAIYEIQKKDFKGNKQDILDICKKIANYYDIDHKEISPNTNINFDNFLKKNTKSKTQ